MATEPVLTRTTKIRIDPEGIVHIESLPGMEERLEDAQVNVSVINSLAGPTSPLILVDIRKLKSMERSAREHYANAPDAKHASRATAMLVGSAVSKVVGNFILGSFSKSAIPTRMFTDEAQAIAWLKGFSG